ncbi:hypothetical protein HTH_0903 [Hydrogenobacter thermophilus TK-6]|uniref:Uncharacterized protein n=1 Tax=Hydrogenobacter thermophilus (strain DSM 6534 / IAM 12695 / TK-6) TaxID=608538 RepID=D3DHR0_HYDTT|nr:hypothetical protein HTH_0903 [Hydrogenobacter thermophilus TK-6]
MLLTTPSPHLPPLSVPAPPFYKESSLSVAKFLEGATPSRFLQKQKTKMEV